MATRKIQQWELAREQKEVNALFKLHAKTHVGIKTAVAWIDHLLQRALNGDTTITGYRDFHRLAKNGVAAEEILKALAVIYIYEQRNRYTFYSDENYLANVGHQVTRLAPQDTKTVIANGKPVKRAVEKRGGKVDLGRHLRDTLVQLLIGIDQEIRSHSFELPEQRTALRADFPVPEKRPTGRPAKFYNPFSARAAGELLTDKE